MDKILLQKMVDEKLVSVQKHPTAELYIYNYTPKVQYERLWNEITLQTRGLILDAEGNVVAKPFGKFFNYEELRPEEIPQLSFEVSDKLDGSLGILYYIDGVPMIATRGSFVSDQAKRATEILHRKYSHLFDKLKEGHTYLFEIIYPENRIVVDYGLKEDLILLTTIHNTSEIETIEDIGFPLVQRFHGIEDFSKLKELNVNNSEGFVIRFSNGYRLKLKFDEYIRLHRLITGISNKTVWTYLKDGLDFNELIDKVPDEFYSWLMSVKKQLTSEYESLLIKSAVAFEKCFSEDRKEFALKVMKEYKEFSGILFNMYNKKELHSLIWKMVEPVFSKSFNLNSEENV